MEREEVRELIIETVRNEITPDLISAFDKLSTMIDKITNCANTTQKAVLDALLHSQADNTQLIAVNLELTRVLNELREDHKLQQQRYADELHSAKNIIHEQQKKYYDFLEKAVCKVAGKEKEDEEIVETVESVENC